MQVTPKKYSILFLYAFNLVNTAFKILKKWWRIANAHFLCPLDCVQKYNYHFMKFEPIFFFRQPTYPTLDPEPLKMVVPAAASLSAVQVALPPVPSGFDLQPSALNCVPPSAPPSAPNSVSPLLATQSTSQLPVIDRSTKPPQPSVDRWDELISVFMLSYPYLVTLPWWFYSLQWLVTSCGSYYVTTC